VKHNNNEDVDKILRQTDYQTKAECFALGWNTFDPDNADFDILIRFD
jgi:hypothetical protein